MEGTRRTRVMARALGLWLGALVLLCHAMPGRTQILSGLAGVTLNATSPTSLSIVIPSGSGIDFVLVQGGIANGSASAVVQASWSVNPGQTGAISLYGYFSAPAAALAGTGFNIPSSYVEGRMLTGIPVAYASFTQTNPVGPPGGSLLLFSETITGTNKSKVRNDNLDLRINLTTSPPVPQGSYNGTLRIQARAL